MITLREIVNLVNNGSLGNSMFLPNDPKNPDIEVQDGKVFLVQRGCENRNVNDITEEEVNDLDYDVGYYTRCEFKFWFSNEGILEENRRMFITKPTKNKRTIYLTWFIVQWTILLAAVAMLCLAIFKETPTIGWGFLLLILGGVVNLFWLSDTQTRIAQELLKSSIRLSTETQLKLDRNYQAMKSNMDGILGHPSRPSVKMPNSSN